MNQCQTLYAHGNVGTSFEQPVLLQNHHRHTNHFKDITCFSYLNFNNDHQNKSIPFGSFLLNLPLFSYCTKYHRITSSSNLYYIFTALNCLILLLLSFELSILSESLITNLSQCLLDIISIWFLSPSDSHVLISTFLMRTENLIQNRENFKLTIEVQWLSS